MVCAWRFYALTSGKAQGRFNVPLASWRGRARLTLLPSKPNQTRSAACPSRSKTTGRSARDCIWPPSAIERAAAGTVRAPPADTKACFQIVPAKRGRAPRSAINSSTIPFLFRFLLLFSFFRSGRSAGPFSERAPFLSLGGR